MPAKDPMNTSTPISDHDVLAEATRRICANFQPRRIVLFGSRATGDARPDSDFDLVVVLDSPGDWRTPGRIQGLLRGLPLAFDVFVESTVEWNRWRVVRPTLEHMIDREGTVLLDAA